MHSSYRARKNKKLHKNIRTWSVVEKVNCNSAFMLRILPQIAAEKRQQLHWIPHKEPIYLVMDNAGGHGTQEARAEYTRRLRDDFNIVIIQQSVHSPEVNALDLGIWMSAGVNSWAQSSKQEKRSRRSCSNSQRSLGKLTWWYNTKGLQSNSHCIVADCCEWRWQHYCWGAEGTSQHGCCWSGVILLQLWEKIWEKWERDLEHPVRILSGRSVSDRDSHLWVTPL